MEISVASQLDGGVCEGERYEGLEDVGGREEVVGIKESLKDGQPEVVLSGDKI